MIYNIWFSVLLLFLLLFVGVQYLDSMSRESMRTLYMPTAHPIIQYVKPNYYGGFSSTEDMNQWVDNCISKYFDDMNVPYLNTVDLYRKYIVNKGVLKSEYKNKLRDMCHYLINIVIPNLPTMENPDPKIRWPKIEWLSDDWKAYNYSFNLDAKMNLFGGSTVYKRTTNGEDSEKTGSSTPGSAATPGSAPTPGSSTSGSSSPESNALNGSSEPCANSCPTDCFNKTLSSMYKSATSSPGSASPGSQTVSASPGSDAKQSDDSYESSTGGKYSSSNEGSRILTVDQVLVTNERVKNPSSQELNNLVFGKINYYIDVEFDLYPTSQAQQDFINFVKIYGTIDRSHKNKLRDLIYYFMENIIPGLPTQSNPVCYVEWRPIRWLANSNL